MERITLKIYGKVQGVFFRHYVSQTARELGLVGWVKNDLDGTVVIAAEGAEDKLKKFIMRCRKGPPNAKVEKIESAWQKYSEEFNDFEVR
ncbi:MAG: hypothetical protein A2667_02190 [Candidatus Wildermuthbacteria bacterium RIFCSPHIGHO2_01_FULL_47_27]|uniref:Acylphosphatase n=2 Tax=Candidatus Wildermuthiibacteriota TaxID=1817923 RepID=A0A1G2RMD2_9BACT|nr:MAG: Acylphosphatase [Parcubacteria group bacterium GW2011_GWA2_47_9]OHA63498.1 MAG: hypothetical protein A2667_02190 [Candidatus Wildermuthbacteria bacterium RIFCSPHIGHO2_01_FULL_47_27]OHA67706.1 MAG: hypothetical protein A3D59_04715 [Candidatus Wildermuthbacteria bacterium RIFCSPHIGHO2_02_FULL_47_17]OHA73986.1 MAG: hypothetical protein A3A32_01090 [Candidatus Wildermuthbacteria bacterium RIFCSPLOWO2_01_FULL_48_35]OHA75587.1 MAG: hypothetical protein A3I38_03795 [Candidatus Wildermuthbacter